MLAWLHMYLLYLGSFRLHRTNSPRQPCSSVYCGAILQQMTITGVAPAHYDPNFACCGGCSSSRRADAYNDKLVTGARIFIWDEQLKTNPRDVCLLTFPYDPALNEQEGERRVRSGRLVGTSYPIDHDYDSLCCEQRGECLALEEDASGQCRCVKRWGFTGDHCQDSIFDVARVANADIFPNPANLSAVQQVLPDLRGYLLTFDFQPAIAYAASPSAADDSFQLPEVLETGTYRQFVWSASVYFVAAAAFFALIFLLHVMWRYCCFKCGCRRRNPLAKPKIYGKKQKIAWGLVMVAALLVGTVGAIMSLLVVHNDIEPLAQSALTLLNDTLPSNLRTFEDRFLFPMEDLLANGYKGQNGGKLLLSELQERSKLDLMPHTFLDNHSYASNVIGQPVFDVLEPLANYSTLFPIKNSNDIDCDQMNITTPSVTSRMTIGAATGCFKCKRCLSMTDLVVEAKDSWRRNPFEIQIDLLVSKRQLREFADTTTILGPAIRSFLDRMHATCSDFRAVSAQMAARYDQFVAETRQVAMIGLYGLVGLSGLALVLSIGASVRGILTDKRPLGRTTCFFAEMALLVAMIVVGVLYSMAIMAQDAITVLSHLEANTSVFLTSAQAATDAENILFDRSLIEATGMNNTLAFSDTLRVPPHPTPWKDDPERFDIETLYALPALFELETLTARPGQALVELFGWSDEFVQRHYERLQAVAFGNDTVTSPYNETLHKTLLSSSTQRFMDPDNDSELVTARDLLQIRTVFNASWRGLSDQGLSKNEEIHEQWLFVAQLYRQRERLESYTTAVSTIISQTHPLLSTLAIQTAAMEDAEFQLKAAVEHVTDTLRKSRMGDCGLDGNCGWFRAAVNELFDTFQQLLTFAEHAAITCAASAVALLVAVVCANGFTSRLRRNVVKVYSGR